MARPEQKQIKFSVWVEKEEHEIISSLAKEENRTITNYIMTLVKKEIKENK